MLGSPNGVRTRVFGVRGRYPRPLDDGTTQSNGNHRTLMCDLYKKKWPYLSSKCSFPVIGSDGECALFRFFLRIIIIENGKAKKCPSCTKKCCFRIREQYGSAKNIKEKGGKREICRWHRFCRNKDRTPHTTLKTSTPARFWPPFSWRVFFCRYAYQTITTGYMNS